MSYGSSDYLSGHKTQKRCGLCEHHPILSDGRCLDCGVVNPRLFGGDMQSSESEVIAQRPPRQEMDAPVFVEVMRAPLPGVSTGPALAPTTGMRGTVSTSAAGADTYRVEVGSSAAAVDVAENRFPDAAAAGVVLWTAERTVLVGWDPNRKAWTPPGGKWERGESIRACAMRELFEEAGLHADDLQINWSDPTYIPSGKYVYYQGQLSGHQPSATRALTEFKHVHIHDSLVDCSFCLERVISNLRGGGKPRRVGLLEGFAEATNASRTRLPASDHSDASAIAPRVEEPPAKRRRADDHQRSIAGAGPAPREERKRTTRNKRAVPTAASPTEPDQVFTLSELCNEAALEDLASRRRAATWQPRSHRGAPHGPSLRRIISDYLRQVREGALTTVFREEDRMLKLGLRGRRYSGYKRGIGDEVPSLESLITSGVNAGSVARSFFGLPNWLRDIARVGLPNCFIHAPTHPAPPPSRSSGTA